MCFDILHLRRCKFRRSKFRGTHKKESLSEVLTTKETSIVTLLTRTALLHIFSSNKSQFLQYQSSSRAGQFHRDTIWFFAILITRWIVIVERYIKAEFSRISSSCLSSCLFRRDWLLLEDMNTWSLEVGNSFILFFFSVPCAKWLVSFKGITQHLADI